MLALTFLPGCGLHYVTQAAAGQYELVARSEEIEEILEEKRVTPRTQKLLTAIPSMKRFGEGRGLKATENYTRYVQVDRPYIVWVVTAARPLSLSPRTFNFPIVGSFNYLGWFREKEARAYAAELEKEGWDVDVRGSQAYSTTGFFRDPVLSTMIPKGRHVLGDLASTILHESTHATVFVHDQSVLNESIANFVGDQMALEYLIETKGKDSDETKSFIEIEDFVRKRGAELHEAVVYLKALYASNANAEEKLRAKAAYLKDLRKRIRYSRPITNATLVQYRTYHSGQAELAELFTHCGEKWTPFLNKLRELEKRDFAERQMKDVGSVIAELAKEPCD